jgi:hypothetical protein
MEPAQLQRVVARVEALLVRYPPEPPAPPDAPDFTTANLRLSTFLIWAWRPPEHRPHMGMPSS